MNIKKSKMALALSGLLFLSVPVASVLADQKHTDMKMMQQSETGTMKSIESELRGYVKAFKADNSQKMQQHIKKLLQLNEKASTEIPAKIYSMHPGGEMDHSQMDHSKMDMAEMDHSQMDQSKMDMAEMDHSQMNHGDMNMNSADHDMSAMPSMEGMSSAQHHQHMIYMQGTEKLQAAFEQLANTQDKSAIKAILGEVKMIIKNNQLFR